MFLSYSQVCVCGGFYQTGRLPAIIAMKLRVNNPAAQSWIPSEYYIFYRVFFAPGFISREGLQWLWLANTTMKRIIESISLTFSHVSRAHSSTGCKALWHYDNSICEFFREILIWLYSYSELRCLRLYTLFGTFKRLLAETKRPLKKMVERLVSKDNQLPDDVQKLF